MSGDAGVPTSALRTVLASGPTKVHLEAVTKLGVAKSSLFAFVRLLVQDTAGQARTAEVEMFPDGPLVNFCHPTGASSATCASAFVTEDLTVWRKITVDIDTAGGSKITVDGHEYVEEGATPIAFVSSGSAVVGADNVVQSGNVIWLDDALISTQ